MTQDTGTPAAAWGGIRDLIDAGEADPLVRRLLALDDGERKLVAGELRGHIAVMRARTEARESTRWTEDGWDQVDQPWEKWPDLVRLAGAGTLSAVSAVASWVTRRDLTRRRPFSGRDGFGDPAPLLRLLSVRPAAWQAELAVRLAARLRGPRDTGVPLALALLRSTGAPPPEHDPLVVAWVSEGSRPRPDPLLPALMPRLFEAEGVGRVLRHERIEPLSPWLRRLRGHGDRKLLLDGCVRRFLRGGSAQDLRFFVRLHELLAPSEAEVAERARDYLRLLPASPGPVAELALRHLRRMSAHEPGDVVEAIEGLMFRAEATLARTGLTWLDQSVRQAVVHPDEIAPALASAFHHASYEVQGRAAQLALKHAERFGPLGAEQIGNAVPALPSALGQRLVARFGGQAAVEEPPQTPSPLPPAPTPRAFPPVPATPGELRSLDWPTRSVEDGERWMAGFVRLASRDRQGLWSALAPVVGSGHPHLYEMRWWTHVDNWLAAMAMELIAPGGGLRPEPVPVPPRDRLPRRRDVSSPHLFLLRRCAEILVALKDGALPPVLLATPTHSTGLLDPDVLVARLEECEAAQAVPLTADLLQALLRLPRGAHPEAAARAATLTSRAAGTAARWLADGGPPDPETGVRWRYIEDSRERFFDERPPRHVDHVVPSPRLSAPPTGFDLLDDLLAPPLEWSWNEHGRCMDWWASTLPSHREVVAVNLLPHLISLWNGGGVHSSQACRLAAADGPPGAATALVIAFFLGRRDSADGVSAFLTMAARGDLPAAGIGAQLGMLVRWTGVKLRHVVGALESAAAGGAHREVWQVLRALLPTLLPAAGERPQADLAKAVELAVTVAGPAGAREEIPEVAAIAARRSDSRLTHECRRLHERLSRA
ncbi:DUF6493 family protein [Nonomuraea sp. NPDC049152]|uniref:DUF7824 domain-containing protein n=1 Tax=Nonomuraea sp. NPDC049152 TaxID=3154350 RepID=UPI0033CD70C2